MLGDSVYSVVERGVAPAQFSAGKHRVDNGSLSTVTADCQAPRRGNRSSVTRSNGLPASGHPACRGRPAHYHRWVATSRRSLVAEVPAKINLLLRVGAVRPDGFHELVTVFHGVELYDRVVAETASDFRLTVAGPEAGGLTAGPDNLVWRAAMRLAELGGIQPSGTLTVDKHIPLAAGLAGGSADAAATLRVCNELWQLGATERDLATLAAELGSDVPFALGGGTALGTGRGEQLTAFDLVPELHWVIAAADGGLSSPAVYAQLDRQRGSVASVELPSITDITEMFASPDPAALAGVLGNDLQPAAIALAPFLQNTLDAGTKAGALAALVSGSGPTCVFLAADLSRATQLAHELQASGTCRYARPVRGNAVTRVSER